MATAEDEKVEMQPIELIESNVSPRTISPRTTCSKQPNSRTDSARSSAQTSANVGAPAPARAVLRNPFVPADQPPNPLDNDPRAEVHFKTLKWWHCGMLMIAETISLGILSLPSTLALIGLIPGVIVLVGLGILATYSAYVIGQFKAKYPWVQHFGDAFEILFGPLGHPRFGKELGGLFQTIFLLFAMASHIVTWVICMNTLTDHGTCNIVWGVVALFLFWALDLPRTLKNVSYFSIASFVSIVAAVLVCMFAVGIDHKGVGSHRYSLWPHPDVTFVTAFSSVANIVFAYAGHAAFFGFISELRDPREFPKALALLQITDIALYIIVAVTIYYYAGYNVDSPALSSSSALVAKIAYGLAIPTIVIAGVIYGHVCAKYIYVRYLAGTGLITKKSRKAFGQWALVTGVLWTAAWVLATSIPDFNSLLSFIAALLASWMTYGVPGIFWLFIYRGQWFSSKRRTLLTVVNFSLLLLGAVICFLGLYASLYTIVHSPVRKPWKCGVKLQAGVGIAAFFDPALGHNSTHNATHS